MKKKNLILIIVGIVLIAALMIGGVYLLNHQKTYTLNLPAADTIASITIKYNDKSAEIIATEEITDIISTLNNDGKRTTKTESISDSPRQANAIRLDFTHSGNGATTVFVYQDGDLYYLEQPYNGIYRISPDEYNGIYKRVR